LLIQELLKEKVWILSETIIGSIIEKSDFFKFEKRAQHYTYINICSTNTLRHILNI
jgi:hypothetical protein